MKKKLLYFIFFLLTILKIFSIDSNYKIIEIKGKVDMRPVNGEWKAPEIDEIITGTTEIFTGFHSQITFEVGNNSYVTLNQLTNATLTDTTTDAKNEFKIVGVELTTGYIVANAKEKNKIVIMINSGKDHAEFGESNGEVYYRKDNGALIKSFAGMVKIGAKLSKMYFIKKGEVCGITPGGKLLESDYFLRREINIAPNNIIDPKDLEIYYELLSIPYTSEPKTNDYSNVFRP